MTHKVSVFSQGLLTMQSTLVGIVRVDPKELLESGIRDELSIHIKSALENGLSFSPKLRGSDLKQKLEELGATMEGHKNSFEYVQDYIGINGIKMWQEELKNIIMESVEIECKNLQKKGSQCEILGNSFMGCLAKQLLLAIDPKTTFFSEQQSVWADCKTRMKIVDLNLFKKILIALSVPGLVGIDKIISFLIAKMLQDLILFLQREANNNKAWLEMFGSIAKSLTPYSITVDQPTKVYPNAVTRLSKLFNAANLLDILVMIGNLQILRKQISFTLNQSAKICARNYTSNLLTLNDSFLLEVLEHKQDCEKMAPSPTELGTMAEMLTWIGANEPYQNIYVTSRSIPYLHLLLFLFSTAHVPRFFYDKSLATYVCKKTGEGILPLVIGIHTLLKQFNSKTVKQFILLASQYAKSYMLSSALAGKQEIPQEGLSMMFFLEEFVKVGDHPRALITLSIPDVILDLFKHGLTAYANS